MSELKPLYSYDVFLKKHGTRFIQAYGYTEDSDSGRTFFHRSKDLSDKDTFFITSEITGIERKMSEGEIQVNREALAEWLKNYLALLPPADETEQGAAATL
jgi:hypothetical protein